MASKKKEPIIHGTRAESFMHLADLLLPNEDDYIRERYRLGLKEGMMQVTLSFTCGTVSELEASTRTMIKKKEWKKDPRINGVLNGRRLGFSMFMDIDDEMVIGDWADD